jgi:hypothetical protein
LKKPQIFGVPTVGSSGRLSGLGADKDITTPPH